MFVLDLCKEFCPEKIPDYLGERINGGCDGEVFEITTDPNKVIKLSAMYSWKGFPDNYYQNTVQVVLNYLSLNKPSIYAEVYEYGLFGQFFRRNSEFIIHYYIMDKLIELSDDEKKVFHSLISHEDRNIKKDLSLNRIKKNCEGLSRGLDFDVEKVILFCQSLQKVHLLQSDMHPRNIMKDNNGYYKMIDFDRITIGD